MKHDTLKQLKSAYQQASKRKYPNVPDHGRPAIKLSDSTANGLTKAILIWMELNGHKAWRQSSEGRYRPGKQYTDALGHRKQLTGKYLPGANKGHSDVQSIIGGLFVAWEVKMMSDRQSRAQKAFQAEVEASGGRYFVVRTFDQFMRHYRSLLQIDKQP